MPEATPKELADKELAKQTADAQTKAAADAAALKAKQDADAVAAKAKADADAALAAKGDPVAAEKTRCRDILAMCGRAGQHKLADDFIAQNLSVADVQAKLFNALCNERPPIVDTQLRESEKPADPNEAFKKEYAAHKAVHEEHGVTEEMFVASRRVSAGLDKLQVGK